MQFDIEKLSSDVVQNFIFNNASIDEEKLLVSDKDIGGVPSRQIGAQIRARNKAKAKFPSFYNQRGIIYPRVVNLEQSSSEETAKYKAATLRKLFPDAKSIIDLTGGFGIDSLFLSHAFEKIQYVEPDASLLEIAQHNHNVLKAFNISHHHSTAEAFIRSGAKADVCYLDPSRRVEGRKTFLFKDCIPNVVELLPELAKVGSGLMIKASPLMDVSLAIRELGSVFHTFVVAVNNDCKEVIYMCRPGHAGEPMIECVDLKDDESFVFTPPQERDAICPLSKPLEYVFEPNVAILKAGAFKSIGQHYHLKKLDVNTHLYTSSILEKDFPGRIFRVNRVLSNKKEVNEALPDGQANIILRNYPGTTAELKSSLGIRDGGNTYLLAATSLKTKLFMLVERIK